MTVLFFLKYDIKLNIYNLQGYLLCNGWGLGKMADGKKM